MSFPKAPLVRFLDKVGTCVPGPGTYDPKSGGRTVHVASFNKDKQDRFRAVRDGDLPGPAHYNPNPRSETRPSRTASLRRYPVALNDTMNSSFMGPPSSASYHSARSTLSLRRKKQPASSDVSSSNGSISTVGSAVGETDTRVTLSQSAGGSSNLVTLFGEVDSRPFIEADTVSLSMNTLCPDGKSYRSDGTTDSEIDGLEVIPQLTMNSAMEILTFSQPASSSSNLAALFGGVDSRPSTEDGAVSLRISPDDESYLPEGTADSNGLEVVLSQSASSSNLAALFGGVDSRPFVEADAVALSMSPDDDESYLPEETADSDGLEVVLHPTMNSATEILTLSQSACSGSNLAALFEEVDSHPFIEADAVALGMNTLCPDDKCCLPEGITDSEIDGLEDVPQPTMNSATEIWTAAEGKTYEEALLREFDEFCLLKSQGVLDRLLAMNKRLENIQRQISISGQVSLDGTVSYGKTLSSKIESLRDQMGITTGKVMQKGRQMDWTLDDVEMRMRQMAVVFQKMADLSAMFASRRDNLEEIDSAFHGLLREMERKKNEKRNCEEKIDVAQQRRERIRLGTLEEGKRVKLLEQRKREIELLLAGNAAKMAVIARKKDRTRAMLENCQPMLSNLILKKDGGNMAELTKEAKEARIKFTRLVGHHNSRQKINQTETYVEEIDRLKKVNKSMATEIQALRTTIRAAKEAKKEIENT